MNEGSITAGRNDLAAAITYAATAVSKCPLASVMTGMPVNIWAGHVTFGGFDYETSVSVKVPGEVTSGAATLVDGRALLAAVKAMPAGKRTMATLTITGDQLTVTCDGIESALARMDGAGYPCMPGVPEVSGVVGADVFCTAATRVIPAACTDDTLPLITHVCISSMGGVMELAATDRYRLAIDRVTWTGPDVREVLVPSAVLAGFVKAADRSGKITVHIGDTHTALSDGTRTVVTRTYPLSETGRTFPDYGKLVRSDHGTVVTADAKQLHDAVARAAKLAGKKDRTGFEVTGSRITVTAVKDGQAVGTQHVACEVDGPEHSTGFHAPYLASMLAGYTGPVRIGFKVTTHQGQFGQPDYTREAPAVITADGSEFTAVVCTLRAADK